MQTVPDCLDCRSAPARRGPAGLLASLRHGLALLFPPRSRRLLDARTLPDHLKRDIGVTDGNDPRGPRP